MNERDAEYRTAVVTGEALNAMTASVRKFEKRDCYGQLLNYLNSESTDRVCIVYGLRRTGKTTMLRQAIGDLPVSECVYIKAKTSDTMADMNYDLKLLFKNGFKYIFLDEITLVKDFIDSAALFSDVFAAQGMKIVLSGTDSLGFWLSLNQELYDRAQMIHTTFIPFREHSRLLKIDDLDEYIRYGGTLRAGETKFDDKELFVEEASFRDDESTRRYIDTAICKNIQNSLALFEHGSSFRHLYKLYESGELTNAVNRIIEDMNHSFVMDVLNRSFISNDLGVSASNLRKARDPDQRTDILDEIDISSVTSRLMKILDIRNAEDRSIGITDTHIKEIKEYLEALDLIIEIPYETTIEGSSAIYHTLFTQPGMRFCQVQALVHSLTKDAVYSAASEHEKSLVANRILNEVRGRMTEEIVLLETFKMLGKYREVFKLKTTARGEFDMVIYNRENHSCEIYEVKHSAKAVPEQYRHLINPEECEPTEARFGKITRRVVLYNGEDMTVENNVEYLNVGEYLKHLPLILQDIVQSDEPSWGMNFGV